MSRPRTPRHFPRMKVRGARRRATAAVHRLHRFLDIAMPGWEQWNSFEDTAAPPATPDPGSDDYLAAHGGEHPPATSPCPGAFLWSAFGAEYPDTECHDGTLADTDDPGSDSFEDMPCPMHRPGAFWEQHYGGTRLAPVCLRCGQGISSGTPIVFHERGLFLDMSAHCNACRKRTWVGTREDRSAFADEIPPYEYPAAA